MCGACFRLELALEDAIGSHDCCDCVTSSVW
jgi:hypothetical protein